MATRFLLIWGLIGASLRADAPQLKYFKPAGMQRGATTTVQCQGEFNWPPKIWSLGAEVTPLEESGQIQVHVPKGFPGDRVWVRLYNDDGVSQAVPLMVGNLPETTEKEPNNTTTDPQLLSKFAPPPRDAEVVVNGVLQERGDVDAFAVELKRGQVLVAAVEANEAFGSPIDAILQIVLPDGTVLAENHDDVGLDPRLAFTAPDNGRYIARVFAFPAKPNQTIRFHGGNDYVYRLKLTTGPFITHAHPLNVCDPQTSVSPRGWNIPPGAKFTPQQATADSRNGYVLVPGWAGSARVGFLKDTVISESPSTSKASPLEASVPMAFTGVLEEPETRHYFRLRLEKDQQVRIQVEAMTFYSPLAPQAKLLGPDQKVVLETPERGASKDVSWTHTAKQPGDYLLVLRDRFGHGGERYFYALKISEPQTDFRLTLDKESLVIEEGEAELVVNVQRESGVGPQIGDIEISAVHLPPGVLVEPVTSQPAGETAKKVTLRFVAEGKSQSTSQIQVQGVAKTSQLRRLATTPIRFKNSFDHLWLSVKRAPAKTPDKETPAAE